MAIRQDLPSHAFPEISVLSPCVYGPHQPAWAYAFPPGRRNPYNDAIWAILTGCEEADALRIAQAFNTCWSDVFITSVHATEQDHQSQLRLCQRPFP